MPFVPRNVALTSPSSSSRVHLHSRSLRFAGAARQRPLAGHQPQFFATSDTSLPRSIPYQRDQSIHPGHITDHQPQFFATSSTSLLTPDTPGRPVGPVHQPQFFATANSLLSVVASPTEQRCGSCDSGARPGRRSDSVQGVASELLRVPTPSGGFWNTSRIRSGDPAVSLSLSSYLEHCLSRREELPGPTEV